MAIIPHAHLGEAEARVAKVNKRAAKLGVEGVMLDVSEPFEHTFYYAVRDGEVAYKAQAVEVTVTGPTVQLAGWTFLASIDHFEGLVRATPDAAEIELSAYTEESVCEHCETNRERKNTYIVRHEDGDLVQVGSTCIKDFLGHDVNLSVLGMLSAADDLEEEFDGYNGMNFPNTHPLAQVLSLAATAIRIDGWVPRSAARYGNDSTSDTVKVLLDPRTPEKVLDKYEATDEDTAIAEAARAWALDMETNNDYLFNLSQIANNDFVTYKSMGLAVSMISAYRRSVEKEVERRIEREQSSPVPVTDERIEVTGTVINVTYREGYYSDAVKKITVRDDRGFKLWGTCPSAIESAEQGDRVTFTARVERGDRDETFGWFRRPTKAAILKEGS